MRDRFVAFAILTLALTASSSDAWCQETGVEQPKSTASKTVELSVRFKDGRIRKFEPVECREGMTVIDMMNELKERKEENPLRFEYKGKGKSAFLLSLDGVDNQSGGSSDFWIFRVNGKLSDRSFGIYELHPGDKVLWHFGKFMPE